MRWNWRIEDHNYAPFSHVEIYLIYLMLTCIWSFTAFGRSLSARVIEL